MLSRSEYFEGTTRTIVFTCPKCSSSEEIPEQPLDTRQLEADGFKLVDGAWTGLCEDCQAGRVDASNAEYEALIRAAAQICRIGKTGPLANIQIPEVDGFGFPGQQLFGFWAISHAWDTKAWATFVRSARLIVRTINENRGTELVVNINSGGTQMIVHGIVD